MKICIVGNVGDNNVTCSGQILRTRITKDSLEARYGEKNIIVVNTNNYRKHAVRIAFKLLNAMFLCDCFIVMLSKNGRHIIYPIMYIYKKLFKKHIFNNVIGGGYASDINNNPEQIKYSKTYDINWVQSRSMVIELIKIGVNNVELLPNTKPQIISNNIENRSVSAGGKYIFCTFSRILREKGIEEAIDAVCQANEVRGKKDIYLQIFGSIEDNYKERFDYIMKKASQNVRYMGYVEPRLATEKLEKTYALLFPTTWSGEGFPGTVLDGFSAGLPVIATNWNCNSEVIEDGITGIIYDANEKDMLKEYILWAVNNEKRIDEMRINCINEAKKYTPENVMPIIYNKIDSVHRR